MSGLTLNSAGRCSKCHGHVHNIDGKRKSREQLAAVHSQACPGIHRKRNQ